LKLRIDGGLESQELLLPMLSEPQLIRSPVTGDLQ